MQLSIELGVLVVAFLVHLRGTGAVGSMVAEYPLLSEQK
jgi:hypothetical protein